MRMKENGTVEKDMAKVDGKILLVMFMKVIGLKEKQMGSGR